MAKTYAQVSSPTGGLTDSFNISDRTSMLDLPDGTVLYNDSSQRLYVYTPDPTVPIVAAGKPVINSVIWNANGSLHLTGTVFNGISAGAAYGDEAQQDSNYPLVRFTDGSGNVYYGRTLFWSRTSVQTGSAVVSTECVVPGNVFSGSVPTRSRSWPMVLVPTRSVSPVRSGLTSITPCRRNWAHFPIRLALLPRESASLPRVRPFLSSLA